MQMIQNESWMILSKSDCCWRDKMSGRAWIPVCQAPLWPRVWGGVPDATAKSRALTAISCCVGAVMVKDSTNPAQQRTLPALLGLVKSNTRVGFGLLSLGKRSLQCCGFWSWSKTHRQKISNSSQWDKAGGQIFLNADVATGLRSSPIIFVCLENI